MTAKIVSLAIERTRRLGVMLATADDPDAGTYHAEAALSLNSAIQKLAEGDVSGAFRRARNAAAILEILDGGVTLEADRLLAERRRRRIARGAKAAETRKRNKDARNAAAEGGAT